MAKITENFFRNTTSEKLNKQLELNRYTRPIDPKEVYACYLKNYNEEERKDWEEAVEEYPSDVYFSLTLEYLKEKLKFDYDDRKWLYEEMFIEGKMYNDIYNLFYKSRLEGKKRPWED